MNKKLMLALAISNATIALSQEAASPFNQMTTTTANGVLQNAPAPVEPATIMPTTVTPAPVTTPVAAPVIAPMQSGQPSELQKPEGSTVEAQPSPAPSSQQMPAASPAETTAVPAEQSAQAPTEEPIAQPIQEEQPKAESESTLALEPAEEEDAEIKNITTTTINDKGNWLLKRIWWEKAERLYEKIKQLTDKILESRMIFYVRRNELERTVIDPFYLNLGLTQGELNEIISFFTGQANQERSQKGSLNEKELALINAVNDEKKTLEQLQKGAQTVEKIEQAIDDALMKLIEQLNQAKSYEQQAWENFKAINRELNDKKARELYYGMDTYWKNLNTINNYLSDAFAKYFDQLTQKVQQETENVKTTIVGLKEKGIDIQSQALKLKQAPCPVKEETELEQEPQTGILGTLWSWITAPFRFVATALGGITGWMGSWFGGSSSESPEEITLAKPAREARNQSSPSDSEAPEDQE